MDKKTGRGAAAPADPGSRSAESVPNHAEGPLAKPLRIWHQIKNDPAQAGPLVTLAVLLLALLWSYWNSLAETARIWRNPLYSHGYLVPVFAAVLVAVRYRPLRWGNDLDRFLGLGLLALGLAFRLTMTRMAYISPEMMSMVPCVIGILLMVGGRDLLRWAGPPAAFLLFMYPMPSFIQDKILVALQDKATQISTFALQTLGIPAYCKGNAISLGDVDMAVIEACSGLRMATNLLALAVAVVLISERPWWDRLIVLLSAVPIAIAVNVFRIAGMGVYYQALGEDEVVAVDLWMNSWLSFDMHQLFGFLMMPLALVLLLLEFYILGLLVIDEEDGSEVVTAGIGGGLNSRSPRPL